MQRTAVPRAGCPGATCDQRGDDFAGSIVARTQKDGAASAFAPHATDASNSRTRRRTRKRRWVRWLSVPSTLEGRPGHSREKFAEVADQFGPNCRFQAKSLQHRRCCVETHSSLARNSLSIFEHRGKRNCWPSFR